MNHLTATRGYRGLGLLLGIYAAVLAAVYVVPDPAIRQSWPVIVTGALIVWYTWETMLLRETAAHQAEIALRQRDATLQQIEVTIRPFVIMDLDAKRFVLRNIGAAPALNVQVLPVTIDPVVKLVVQFSPAFPVIPAGSTAILTTISTAHGTQIGNFFEAHLDPKFATKMLDVIVVYQNVEGKEYRVNHAVGPSTVKVGGFKAQAI